METYVISHKSARDVLYSTYGIYSEGVFVNSKELCSVAKENTVVVVSSLSELGDGIERLLVLKHIFGNNADLYVLGNEDASTIVIKTKDFGSYFYSDKNSISKRKLATVLLSDLDDNLELSSIPEKFSHYYWEYELGKIKVSEVCTALSISKPYFYRLCEFYETTIHFYSQQGLYYYELIRTPKKNETDYKTILALLEPFYEQGLTYEALNTLQDKLKLSNLDVWRTLNAMQRSRFYYYLLKNNANLKAMLLFKDIECLLTYLMTDTHDFVNIVTRYHDADERVAEVLDLSAC